MADWAATEAGAAESALEGAVEEVRESVSAAAAAAALSSAEEEEDGGGGA